LFHTTKLIKLLNKYKASGYVECNGAQDSIYEQIRNKVNYNKSSVQSFVTTAKSKPIIIEDMIVNFEDKNIGIIGYDWQVAELEVFAYEYNVKTRSVKYSAPTGLHDDYVMSRAICNHAYRTLKTTGIYSII